MHVTRVSHRAARSCAWLAPRARHRGKLSQRSSSLIQPGFLSSQTGPALTDAKQALAQLADEFQDILKDLRDRLGQNTNIGSAEGKPRGKRSKSPKTPQRVLREHIVRALKKLGGKARVSDVIEEMGRQLAGKLLPGDSVWREATNECAWQNNAKWERFQMTQDGTLRRGSPRGVWELGENDQ